MSSVKSRGDIVDWLAFAGIDRLVILPPHLDDAVLSLGGLIAAEVITVHTKSVREVAVDWACKGGFTDPIQEHVARLRGDPHAMKYLGCRFLHLSRQSGELSEAVARQHVRTPWGSSVQYTASMLFLLPVGAGGHRPLSTTKTWARRILHQPFDATVHPEHERTRDQFWKAFSAIGARMGFYAEIPYVWSEAPAHLKKGLTNHYLSPFETIRASPDFGKTRCGRTISIPSEFDSRKRDVLSPAGPGWEGADLHVSATCPGIMRIVNLIVACCVHRA